MYRLPKELKTEFECNNRTMQGYFIEDTQRENPSRLPTRSLTLIIEKSASIAPVYGAELPQRVPFELDKEFFHDIKTSSIIRWEGKNYKVMNTPLNTRYVIEINLKAV